MRCYTGVRYKQEDELLSRTPASHKANMLSGMLSLCDAGYESPVLQT